MNQGLRQSANQSSINVSQSNANLPPFYRHGMINSSTYKVNVNDSVRDSQ